MLHPRRTLCLLLLVLIALPGCSKKFYPVRGKVMHHEAAAFLREGEVRFQPIAHPSLVASGRIGPDGVYTLSTPDHGEGVLEGQCRVAVIVEPKDGKPVLDEKYADFSTSGLYCTVTEREENFFTLEVHTKRP